MLLDTRRGGKPCLAAHTCVKVMAEFVPYNGLLPIALAAIYLASTRTHRHRAESVCCQSAIEPISEQSESQCSESSESCAAGDCGSGGDGRERLLATHNLQGAKSDIGSIKVGELVIEGMTIAQ